LVGPAETVPKEKLQKMYDLKELPKEEVAAMLSSIPEDHIKEVYPGIIDELEDSEGGDSSPVVPIILGILGCLAIGAALFGAKVCYDRRKLRDKQLDRAKSYEMKDIDDENSQNESSK
jgi:hypothetical protein